MFWRLFGTRFVPRWFRLANFWGWCVLYLRRHVFALHERAQSDNLLHACRRESWGQLIGSYVVAAMMFAAGGVVAAALVAHRVLMRRKVDGYAIHVLIQHIASAVWWSHNHVLSHVFGRGS